MELALESTSHLRGAWGLAPLPSAAVKGSVGPAVSLAAPCLSCDPGKPGGPPAEGSSAVHLPLLLGSLSCTCWLGAPPPAGLPPLPPTSCKGTRREVAPQIPGGQLAVGQQQVSLSAGAGPWGGPGTSLRPPRPDLGRVDARVPVGNARGEQLGMVPCGGEQGSPALQLQWVSWGLPGDILGLWHPVFSPPPYYQR